jgi:DNA-binding transcriptional MerR regulator
LEEFSVLIGEVARRSGLNTSGFSIAETRAFVSNNPSGGIPSARWRAMADRKLQEMDTLNARATQIKSLLQSSFKCGCSTIQDCENLILESRV